MAEKTLLFEIGVEEIPARFLPGAVNVLEKVAKEIFNENYLFPDDKYLKAYATPRRLVLIVDHLKESQKPIPITSYGPPKKVAVDAEGNYTKAALGFAKKEGVDIGKLRIRTKDKGEYLVAEKSEGGGNTIDLLPDILKQIILALYFPKSMRWGSGTLRFVRPIHWILALFGTDTVAFEIDGIRSGNTSRGHRFLSPGNFRIKDAGTYHRVLEDNYVIVDQNKRESLIRKQVEECAKSVSGFFFEYDEELILTVTNLVEYPHTVLGSFPEEYLDLPPELLIAVMKGHQKYFPVRDERGNLKNYFVIVSNTKKENSDVVRTGAERVIRARFEDARFYFEEDRKKPLIDRLNDLKKVTYQERLGSLYDKTMRLKAIAGFLSEKICPEKKGLAERAVLLSKTDLMTGVVREFPELQGVMGMYYARHDGEGEEVAAALREQYLPAHSGDRLPATEVGAVLSLSDRMDNVASFFSIGLTPTGSEDPFALRRQAIGIIAVLMEKEYDVSVKELLEVSLSTLAHIPESEKAGPEILRFFEQRLELLLHIRGYSFDLIQSVMSLTTEVPLGEVLKRLDALKEFKSRPEYNDFLIAVKRVRNIIPERELPPLNEELFKADEERQLFKELGEARAIGGLVEYSNYIVALEEAVKLTGSINKFFDNVLVMDRNEAVRDNRLSLLREIWVLVSIVADFSRLSEV